MFPTAEVAFVRQFDFNKLRCGWGYIPLLNCIYLTLYMMGMMQLINKLINRCALTRLSKCSKPVVSQ